MTPFVVNYDAVYRLRASVITVAMQLVRANSLRPAVKAVGFLESALHYPMVPFNGHLSNDVRAKYTREFCKTLATLKTLVTKGNLHPVIAVAITLAVAWHANFSDSATSATAKAIMRALPNTLEVRTLSAMVDGYGRIFLGPTKPNMWRMRLNEWMANVVADLATAYPGAIDLRRFLESCLKLITETQLTKEDTTNTLIHELLRTRPDFALELVESAQQSPNGPLAVYLGQALFFVVHNNKENGRRWARRLLDAGGAQFQRAVGRA